MHRYLYSRFIDLEKIGATTEKADTFSGAARKQAISSICLINGCILKFLSLVSRALLVQDSGDEKNPLTTSIVTEATFSLRNLR